MAFNCLRRGWLAVPLFLVTLFSAALAVAGDDRRLVVFGDSLSDPGNAFVLTMNVEIPPFQLISEYPDETIYGDAFRLAHTTQMNTVLHAAELVLDHGMLLEKESVA